MGQSSQERLSQKKIITNAMNLQAQSITVTDLISKGYTISAAARAIHRSKTHVYSVVTGQRISKSVTDELNRLPRRPLQLRERVTH